MRIAEKNRDTKETKIYEKINLDGNGNSDIDTGIGFFDHMLTLFAFHSNFDLVVKADGDLEVCDHHTIEDCGILLGKLFLETYGGIHLYTDTTPVPDTGFISFSYPVAEQ